MNSYAKWKIYAARTRNFVMNYMTIRVIWVNWSLRPPPWRKYWITCMKQCSLLQTFHKEQILVTPLRILIRISRRILTRIQIKQVGFNFYFNFYAHFEIFLYIVHSIFRFIFKWGTTSISVTKWCIVGYRTGALWGSCDRSIYGLHFDGLIQRMYLHCIGNGVISLLH